MRPFRYMRNKDDGSVTDAVAFSDGKYADVIFRVAKVNFVEPESETDGELKLEFDYEILRGNPEDIPEFEREVGDFIVEVLQEQVASAKEQRDYAYSGGTN